MSSTGVDVLRSPEAGVKVIRGGAIRAGGYVAGTLLVAVASVFLLRHLGVVDFGRFVTVTSLIAIVSGVTDAGLTAIGSRELSIRKDEAHRRRLLANLIGLRLVLTPVGVMAATAFAALAGYGEVLVFGTLMAGLGLMLGNLQATMVMPLSVHLQIGRLTVGEVLKQTVMVVAIGVLVAAGASLFPFFTVTIPAGLAALAITPMLVGTRLVVRPAFDRAEWRMLLREALPVAAALAMNVVYFRVLVILMSLLATGVETGLYATSLRIFEIMFGIPSLVLALTLPVLSDAAHQDEWRLRHVLQRMTDVGLVAATYIVVVTLIVAEPVIVLLGGDEYRDAAPVLRIQVFALIGVFLGQAWQLGLIAIRRQSLVAVANAIALVAVVALGLAMIPPWEATGAAIAAVVAETLLAGVLFFLLRRARGSILPRLNLVWKVCLAGLAASAVLLVPAVPALPAAIIASLVYVGAILAMRALPSEVLDAFGLRRLASRGRDGASE